MKRIDTLFAIEREINGLSADERQRVRQERSRQIVDELRTLARRTAPHALALGDRRQAD